MRSEFREPKELPNWIQLDYYRRKRWMGRWCNSLIFWTLGIGAVLMVLLFFSPWTQALYQAGPVSTAHTMFNDDCGQCHRENFQTAWRFIPGYASVRSVPDDACLRCHEGAHHFTGQENKSHSCAGCHREHRGHEALARLPDNGCLECHRNLANHLAGLPAKVQKQLQQEHPERTFRNITGPFPRQHPEFALWLGNDPTIPLKADPRTKVKRRIDPAKFKFTHLKHLKQLKFKDAMPYPEDVRKNMPEGWTMETKDGVEWLQLECAACHQADAAGRYMKSINFENHCSACHPIAMRPFGNFDPKTEKAAEKFARKPLPHDVPEVVRGVLRDRLLLFAQMHKPSLAPSTERLQERLEPWGGAATKDQWGFALKAAQEIEERLFRDGTKKPSARDLKFTNEQVNPSSKLAFAYCLQCHQVIPAETRPKPGLRLAHALPGLPKIKKVGIRDRWFPHSHFKHESHRMLECNQCHYWEKGGKRLPVAQSDTQEHILMPRIQTCQQCHSPSGGARHDCVECHGYHKRGSSYGAHKNLTIQQAKKRE